MRIYESSADPASPISWVETTYTPPSASAADYASHTLLAIPPHWHQHHDEIMTVLEGRMLFNVSGKDIVLGAPASAADEGQMQSEFLIERGTVHGFTVFRGEKVTFRERTLPQGVFKGE